MITSWISKSYENADLKALRILRVLRPLRTVSKFPELKKLVNSILRSFGMLSDILIIMIFYVTLWSITG